MAGLDITTLKMKIVYFTITASICRHVKILTAHSVTLSCQSSELCKKPTIDDFKTLEKTSICWAAVDILVISPWNPASDISWKVQFQV